jgi:UDP-N-acetylmuramyl pentapeptide phosphotransferase/UDP-N-acetylglucosamine-1-phosphate transferase
LTLLICAVAGFMVWNFPKAKIYLGDVGSGYLGVIFALLTLNACWVSPDLFWSLLILLGVLIVDATLTLIRRFKHGQRIFEPHRSIPIHRGDQPVLASAYRHARHAGLDRWLDGIGHGVYPDYMDGVKAGCRPGSRLR